MKETIRARLSRLQVGPRGAKVAVILLFTFCWLIVLLARSNAPRDNAGSEASSLPALATLLQQGELSGRDFQSTFGPATQFLAWAATSVTKTRSSADVNGMIVFVLSALSAILVAIMLLVFDRISWRDSAILYLFCFLLNLFFDVLDFQIVLVLLSAAFAYRIIAADTLRDQMLWATGTGLLCFVSQLVAFQLGIYALVVAVCSLVAGSIATRNGWGLLGIQVVVATLAAANIGLVVVFKMTSANYGLIFDYPNYALEILRGYHNNMGITWQFPVTHTVVLVFAAAYVGVRCVMVAETSDPLDASLFASLGFASVVWLKSAFIQSDVPHITDAFTPVIAALALLTTKAWESKHSRWVWAVAAGALLFVWPSFNVAAPADLYRVVRGEIPIGATLHKLYAGKLPSVNRPLVAPVLESGAASTDALERYYIDAIEKQRREGRDPYLEGIESITRTPNIFEYVYTHFDLAGNEDNASGRYELRQRYQPREVNVEALDYAIPHQLADSGTLKMRASSTCGLLRLQMRIDYQKNPMIFRPSGVELSVRRGDQLVWKGTVLPREPNQGFVTLISPLPPTAFNKVFDRGPVQSMVWDQIDYRALPADLLGSRARRIRVESLGCLDPQKFVEVVPAL